MPFDPIKEFFKRKKTQAKFARAGPGQTLSSEPLSNTATSSSEQSDARRAAAEAAMKRFERSNPKPSQRPRIVPQTTTSSTSIKPHPSASTDSVQEPTKVKQTELPVHNGQAQRDVRIYSTEELAQRIKEPEIDDDFFRLTIEDAKLFKQRYDEERAANEILRTSEMRRRDAEAKKPTSNVARLRFKLPNKMILEASFSGSEQLSLVRDWLVAACLEKSQLELKNFDILFGFKPFKAEEFAKSVKELGLIPATTLTVVPKVH